MRARIKLEYKADVPPSWRVKSQGNEVYLEVGDVLVARIWGEFTMAGQLIWRWWALYEQDGERSIMKGFSHEFSHAYRSAKRWFDHGEKLYDATASKLQNQGATYAARCQ